MDKEEKDLGRLNADFFDEEKPEGQSDPVIAEQEVDFIIRNTACPKGSSVLDIPCGEGHHSQVLAEKYGFNVKGIDGGSRLIDRAGEKYKKPKFSHAYFEDLAGENLVANDSQDAVMCINHSFGYLPTVKENEDFLSNMYSKLKPGGVLVIQTAFVPDKHRTVFENMTADQTIIHGEDSNRIAYFNPSDGPHVDSSLPQDYELSPEDDHFRNLEITNSARVREDGTYGPRKKYAGYLCVKHDGNPNLTARKPIDMPVLRSLAKHAGIADEYIKFHSEPYREGERISYQCMMSLRKPTVDSIPVNTVRESVQNALGRKVV